MPGRRVPQAHAVLAEPGSVQEGALLGERIAACDCFNGDAVVLDGPQDLLA